jgi:hypothetical protein
VLDDPAVVQASEKFVRVIVRRPHAYRFLQKDRNVAIPGIIFLDSQGAVVATSKLDSAEQLIERMNKVAK